MKALFIWNKHSENSVKSHIEKVKQFVKGKDCVFITNEEKFQKLINEWDNTYTKIFVLAELGWKENTLFDGYQKGFEIIEKWNSKSSPCIEFFSMVDRKTISNHVEDNLKFIVKAFSFTDVLTINKKYKFNTESINQYKWRSFQYMALTNYGILDNLSHRLEYINDTNKGFEINLNQLISELSPYKEFIGKPISNFIKKIEYTNNFVYKLKLLIDRRINETKGDKVKIVNLPISIKILVIDDNAEDLALIEDSFQRYSNNYIETTTSGEHALKLIKDKKNIFDIVITDLELLDNEGFYQKIQGIEIFEAVNNSEGVVIGVITGLGRKGIAKLLNINDKLILPKKHLHRFDVDEELDNLLKNLLIQFKQKEDRLKVLYGPSKGSYFGLTGFKTSLAKAFDIEEFKKDTWQYAFKILDKFISKNLKSSDWNKSLKKEENKNSLNADEFISSKLKSLLAQRLILIFLALKNNGIILPNDLEEEYFEVLNANELNINKGYVNRISIPYNTSGLTEPTTNSKGKPDKKINGFCLEARDLFPQELVYIETYNQKKKESDFKIYIKDNSPLTIKWLDKYFNFKDTTWYAFFDVSNDVNDWLYEDLSKVCKLMYSDFIKAPYTSIYRESLENINEYLTISIESEIFPVLPELENIFRKIGDILIDPLD